MRIFGGRWRTSLAWRVTSTIVFLSLAIIYIVGSALFTQLSHGISQEKTNVSLADAQSTTRSVELQLAIARYQTSTTVKKIVSDVLTIPSLTGATSGREVALVAMPKNKQAVASYQGTSNLLSLDSIPEELRLQVQKSKSNVYAESTMIYLSGKSERALVVGNPLDIPGAGKYEFYTLFSLAQQDSTLSLIGGALWLTGAVLILLIGLVTWLVIRQVISPVREAARIATQLTAGDLEQRMSVVGENEIAILGIAFNEMAVSLKQQISRLENLSRLQQRFVADVSHELRTPLTTMRMAAQVIFTARDGFDPVVARSAELLIAQIERFEGLLSDLLEVSRFDAEAAVVDIQKIDITTIVKQTIDYVHPSREQFINLHAPEEPVFVDADSRRIERIMRNLVTNAIDHCDGQNIDVYIAESEGEVAVAVRDYGIGFSDKDNKFLFDRFWRADPSRARIRGGTGLGLSIALEDAKLHQGTLQAWGRPRRGANFVLTLPKTFGNSIKSFPIAVVPPSELSTIIESTVDEDL